ncbi:MAG: hypothetical protein PHG25_03900, partial [Candidatus Pacebacteria bacterium]|nr:hypothetical protein [Candidatus Paceibacterota bacterium]
MRRLLIVSIIIVSLVIVGIIGFYFINNFTYTRHITLPPQLLASSSTDTLGQGQSFVKPEVFGQKDSASLNPASSTISTNAWKTYTNNELGFSVKYPKDLVLNADFPGSLILAVPKDKYFHWPLLDDTKITVTASSSCPSFVSGFAPDNVASVSVDDIVFVRSESADVAAGNVYRELAYDMMSNGLCYRLSLFDHGANGAGLYVSGQALVSQYDAQHQADIDKLVSVFMG